MRIKIYTERKNGRGRLFQMAVSTEAQVARFKTDNPTLKIHTVTMVGR